VNQVAVVTGAFGYSGREIARRLLERGVRVRTLTNHPTREHEFGRSIEVHPYDFDHPDALVRSLEGASALYNTYWVRFPRGPISFERAVENTTRLFDAARMAGVNRVIHMSISNPFSAPDLPYFQGKAALEGALATSSLSYAIVRPTVMFGKSDVFINNIAWLLRRFPFFPIPGDGRYRLQPVHVGDVADLCVMAAESANDLTVDAAGPETFTFEELVRTISRVIGRRRMVFPHVSPFVAHGLAAVVGRSVGDVVLTTGELRGLMAELIVSREHSRCPTSLSEWLARHANDVGLHYTSELSRNYRPRGSVRREARRIGSSL